MNKSLWGVVVYALRLGLTRVAAEQQAWTSLVQFMAFLNDPALDRAQSVSEHRLRQDLARAREVLGEVAYQQAWTTGTRLQPADVVELAEQLAQTPVSPAIQQTSHFELTPREQEVLALVAQGHPDRKVARLLSISPATASKHVSNLLAKLELRNRVELTRWAMQQEPDRPTQS